MNNFVVRTRQEPFKNKWILQSEKTNARTILSSKHDLIGTNGTLWPEFTIYKAVLEECHINHWGWGRSVRMGDITGQDGKDWFSSTTSLYAKVADYIICRRRLSSLIASMETQLILLLAVNGNYRSVSYVCLFRGQFKLEKTIPRAK